MRASCSTAYCHDHLTRSDGSCQHCRTDGTPKVYFSHAGILGARVVRLQSLTLPHGGFCPTECGENVCFSYWGLNKTVGISFIPSAHRARSAKSRFDERYQRTASGATPLRRAKYPRLRGLLRRASRAFLSKPKAINLQGCLLLFLPFSFKQRKR